MLLVPYQCYLFHIDVACSISMLLVPYRCCLFHIDVACSISMLQLSDSLGYHAPGVDVPLSCLRFADMFEEIEVLRQRGLLRHRLEFFFYIKGSRAKRSCLSKG